MIKIDDKDLIHELESRFNQNKKDLQELQEATEQLKTVNKKLEESEAMKSHFLSNIRNEIINPFTSIINLSLQISSLTEKDFYKAPSIAKLIYSEAFELDSQLRNIFAAAELEAGEIQPQIYQTNIYVLIQNIINAFKNKINIKKISVQFKSNFNEETKFNTDPEKLNVIFSNLIDNAINFSKESGKIEIFAEVENNVLTVSIKDYGIGIQNEKKELIFDRFKRIDMHINTMNKGYGLGLSVVKAMTDLLNGTITIESQPDVFSIFTITIPEANPDMEVKGLAFDENEIFF